MNKTLITVIVITLAAVSLVVFFMVNTDEEKPTTLIPYSPGDVFVTNVRDSARLFKTQIVIMCDDSKVADELGKNSFVVRDTILFVLRDQTEADLIGRDAESKVRQDLVDALNKKLNITNIVTVYFNDFVMQ